MSSDELELLFFETATAFRDWLERHHASAAGLWVGYRKRATGRPSLTRAESVDEALCYGWIDGRWRSIDETSYRVRFSPRRAGSSWSTANVRRARQLVEAGRMRPAGLRAFEARREAEPAWYEREPAPLGTEYEAEFRAHAAAWAFFEAQPPSYRKMATWWVIGAKREDTRRRRLEKLIEACAEERRLGP